MVTVSSSAESYNKRRTPGENAFDLVTYVGLGGIANAAISLYISDWVHNAWRRLPAAEQEHAAAKKAFDFVYKSAETLSKPLEPVIGENQKLTGNGAPHYEGAIKYTRRFMQGCAIGAGGWLMIPFIKKLEDNKVELVNWYNQNLTAETGDDHQTRSKLGDDTRQTWIGLFTGRAVAFLGAITVGAWMIEAISKHKGRDWFDSLTDIKRDTLKLKPEKLFKNMSPRRGREVSYQIVGETVFTAIATAVMYVVSKAVSRTARPEADNGNGREESSYTIPPHTPELTQIPQQHVNQPRSPGHIVEQAAVEQSALSAPEIGLQR